MKRVPKTYLGTHACMDRNIHTQRHLGANRLTAATHTLRQAHTHTHLCPLVHKHFPYPHPAVQIPELVLTAAHICADMLKHILPLHHTVPDLEGSPSLEQRGGSLDADSATAWEGEGGQSHSGTWELSGNHSPMIEMKVGERLPVPYPEPASPSKGQQTWTRQSLGES